MPPRASEGSASLPSRTGLALNPVRWRVPRIETYPALIAFAQTAAGKLALFAAFAAVMKLNARGLWIEDGSMWLILTVAAAIVSLAGRNRHIALLVCAGTLLAYRPNWFDFNAAFLALGQENLTASIGREPLRAGTSILCVPLAAAAIALARHFRDHPLGRRPVLAQHIVYVVLLGLAASHLLHGVPQVLLWSIVAVFSSYFSYLAYALIDQRHRQPAPLVLQFASFNPFVWPTPVPMGKGAANWRSVEAASAPELAVTQLKALKLLIWALILKGVLWGFRVLVYGVLGVPPLAVAFERFLQVGTVPAPFGLLSVLANFADQLLAVAIWGHVFVAVARLAGFGLLRNTWRPLSSRTIAEFWNRYIYYFKEVLVHLYFYPTFVRCFKRHPRLRLAFATFMAAGAGNFFLHFIVERNTIVKLGLLEALARMQTYAFYCAVLSAGIIVSQLRTRRPVANASWWRRHFVPSLGVMAFYCFLSFFDGPQRHVALAQHFAFLIQVFRIDPWINAI